MLTRAVKIGNFNTKFTVTRLVYELWPRILHIKLGVFKVAQFNGFIEIYRTDRERQ